MNSYDIVQTLPIQVPVCYDVLVGVVDDGEVNEIHADFLPQILNSVQGTRQFKRVGVLKAHQHEEVMRRLIPWKRVFQFALNVNGKNPVFWKGKYSIF